MEGDIKFDKCIYIPVALPGDKLFHYTSASGLKGIVDGEFWITERHFLNDRTEFKIGTEILCELLYENIKEHKVAERLILKIKEEEERMTRFAELSEGIAFSGHYVISFSLEKDNILLWSEYSNFMGYSLQFDFDKIIKEFSNVKVLYHGKVVYDKNKQKSYFMRTLQEEFFEDNHWEYINSWDDFEKIPVEEENIFVQLVYVYCMLYNMFFKKECFSEEKEYRIICDFVHDGGSYKENEYVKTHFRIKDEVLIPFVKQPIDCSKCLEAVIVGPKNNSDIAVEGLKYYFRAKKMDVEIGKSEMPFRY